MKKILIATWILLSIGLSDCFSQALISISGPTTVCKGEEHQYNYNPTAGLNYTWTVTNGALVFTGSNFARVMWVRNQGTLTLIGKDTTGAIIEAGQVTVNVNDKPEPYITTNVKVGCVPLAYDTTEAPDETDSGSVLFDHAHRLHFNY